MYIEEDLVIALKDSLAKSPCIWCSGELRLEGIHKIKGEIITGVIRCLKCDRKNPVTFKPTE